MEEGIITSMLDNDLYKFTMQSAVLELFPYATASYSFINRGKHKFNAKLLGTLKEQVRLMSELRLTTKERKWFEQKCRYLKPSYFDFLQNYRFDPDEVHIVLDEDGNIVLSIDGFWRNTILWEVPLLALISEVYFTVIDNGWNTTESRFKHASNYLNKMETLGREGCHVSDFGTRRRRNFNTQSDVVNIGRKFDNFSGSSNVLFSMRNDLTPRGTMAHEWIMANSILEGLRNANYYALQNWVRVFNADLGIALTDTYGTDAFLRNFNPRLTRLYDGVRQDSGDPFVFTDKVISHYKLMKTDPRSKVILFSDNLNVEKAIKIKRYCNEKIKVSFGIGTHFTNDFAFCGSQPLNMVIKMSSLNGHPVVKLSDDPRKSCGDRDAIRVAMWTFYSIPLDSERGNYDGKYIH